MLWHLQQEVPQCHNVIVKVVTLLRTENASWWTVPPWNLQKNGYFIRNQCKNVFNAACGIRCNSGYQVLLDGLYIEKYFITFIFTSCRGPVFACVCHPENGVEKIQFVKLKHADICLLLQMVLSNVLLTTMQWILFVSLGRVNMRTPFHWSYQDLFMPQGWLKILIF